MSEGHFFRFILAPGYKNRN